MGIRSYVTLGELCEALADGTLESMHWSPDEGVGYAAVPVPELRYWGRVRSSERVLHYQEVLLDRVAGRYAHRAGVGAGKSVAPLLKAVGRP